MNQQITEMLNWRKKRNLLLILFIKNCNKSILKAAIKADEYARFYQSIIPYFN